MTRVLSALVIFPVVVGIIWGLPPWGTQGLALVVLLLSLREYEHLVDRSGLDVVPGVASAIAVGLFVTLTWHLPAVHGMLLSAVLSGIALVLRGRVPAQGLAVAAVPVFAAVYLGMGVATVPLVREAFGPAALLTILFTQIASDTAQYYTGRAFGRVPLAPSLSPKKTREGAIGGVLAAILVMVGFGRHWLPGLSVAHLVGIGAVLSVIGIAGDLFESMLKRSADVKDASGLIPGHGGMLDRIDALLFTVPVFYVALQWLWRQAPAA